MSRYSGISILLIYCGLLAGCGGGDSGEYRTFQSQSEPQSEGVAASSASADAESASATGAGAGATATNSAVNSAEGGSSGGVVTAPASVESGESGESVEPAVKPMVEAGSAGAGAATGAGAVAAEGGVAGSVPGATAVVSAAGDSGVQSAVPATIVSEQSGLSGPADRPSIDNGVSGEVRQVQLLVPQKRFRRERPSEAVRVSYDDIDLLKVLNMEPVPPNAVEHFPEWLKSLDGKLVRIRGFMYPTFVATGLTEFALARDNGICCFVRQPKIYDIMSVQLAEGETTDYIANRPFDVEGVFRIDPDADQPELSRLYRIEQAKVLQ